MWFQTPEYIHPDTGFKPLPPVYEIEGDEKVYTLVELDLVPALGGLTHRYQIIIVWREVQGRCQYVEDMGISDLWHSGPKAIPCAASVDDMPREWIHCVSEVKDMANQLREIDMEQLLEPEHEDLVQGYHDGVERYFLEKNHVSVSGPSFRTERV